MLREALLSAPGHTGQIKVHRLSESQCSICPHSSEKQLFDESTNVNLELLVMLPNLKM